MDDFQYQMNIFKKCFKNISVKELNARIGQFRNSIDIRSASEESLRRQLRSIFQVELDKELITFFVNLDIQTFNDHINQFYRIRKFGLEDYEYAKKFPSIRKEEDIWSRPGCDVDYYGRLHRPGDSILYTSNNVVNAIYETHCELNDSFFLLIYQSKKSMRIAQIHNIQYIDYLTEEENAKRIIMHNFLLEEFSKYVPEGREYMYKSSLIIYEEFFKNDLIDGFSYTSIKTHLNVGYNMSFTKDQTAKNLNFLGVMGCELFQANGEHEFNIKPLFDGFLNEDNTFSFYNFNSAISKIRFGDFNETRQFML